MVDALFNHPGYLSAKRMLDATVVRHRAIATNIANLETPHYKRVDLAPSFQSELQRAVKDKDLSQLKTLRPALAVDSKAVAANPDGNTVRLEDELTRLGENTLAHNYEAQVVSASLIKLRMAITGRSA
jgi:flagellar basal-body rod protein FlgB